MTKVLLVDDDPHVLAALKRHLEAHGYSVVDALSGTQGLDVAITEGPDLAVLDMRLPGLDGLELTRRLRSWSDVPVLILSGVSDDAAKVQALDAGADDYLVKPFNLDELAARLRALQRRRSAPTEGSLAFGDLVVDVSRSSAYRDGLELDLTPTEWLLLRELVVKRPKLLTYSGIAAAVWGQGYGDEMRHTLRNHLRSLRHKIGDDAQEPRYVRTQTGAGYRWIAEPETGSDEPEAATERVGTDHGSAHPSEPVTGAGGVDAGLALDLDNALAACLHALDALAERAAGAEPAVSLDIVRAQRAAARALDIWRAVQDASDPAT